PDGTVLRFIWERENEETLRFTGLSFDTGKPPAFYDTPRLPAQNAAGQAAPIEKGCDRAWPD
ncbi:MAG: hypothetical protein JO132_13870, partial [Streptosporangiaceae bacterium]|nr:hypothetical protein [Streptosporangiaceae bacterium]